MRLAKTVSQSSETSQSIDSQILRLIHTEIQLRQPHKLDLLEHLPVGADRDRRVPHALRLQSVSYGE